MYHAKVLCDATSRLYVQNFAHNDLKELFGLIYNGLPCNIISIYIVYEN
jgi:hypothetical protein